MRYQDAKAAVTAKLGGARPPRPSEIAAAGWNPRQSIDAILGVFLGAGEGNSTICAMAAALAEEAVAAGKSADYIEGMAAVVEMLKPAGIGAQARE
jgi:hypothetical protein